MDYKKDIIFINTTSKIMKFIRERKALKNPPSIDLPEFGIRYPLGEEFLDLSKKLNANNILYDRLNQAVAIITDQKKWLLFNIEHGS